MQASYSAYRSYRIQEQALFELAEALDGESEPVVMTTEDAVITLEGTLDTQYATWRELLREIFLLEQDFNLLSFGSVIQKFEDEIIGKGNK